MIDMAAMTDAEKKKCLALGRRMLTADRIVGEIEDPRMAVAEDGTVVVTGIAHRYRMRFDLRFDCGTMRVVATVDDVWLNEMPCWSTAAQLWSCAAHLYGAHRAGVRGDWR
ncbi:MAG: hypothetical protein KAG89_02450 [Fulvimarina manganoxydans]|uniref:hypothetical protein n=1 Tax=Fulvimarina manganoxydans TaxID=937218 RepID=UPI002352EA96|nr:hypothetical protein [Fulvimarina manganoxydans]MCK5931005.1 hypothetical protein [Fulvimarina manganoxydans]